MGKSLSRLSWSQPELANNIHGLLSLASKVETQSRLPSFLRELYKMDRTLAHLADIKV